MIPQTGTILCVESDNAASISRCGALTVAGYTAILASPHTAVAVLTQRTFDLIVTSGLSNDQLEPIVKLANGAEMITLDEFTPPTVLLFVVDERLRQLRSKLLLAQQKPRTSFLARFR